MRAYRDLFKPYIAITANNKNSKNDIDITSITITNLDKKAYKD